MEEWCHEAEGKWAPTDAQQKTGQEKNAEGLGAGGGKPCLSETAMGKTMGGWMSNGTDGGEKKAANAIGRRK